MSQLTQDEIENLNRFLIQWSRDAKQQMKPAAKGRIGEKLVNRNKRKSGLIEAVGFQFPRFGVFYEMGVFGRLSRQKAIALGKLKPKPWFNPALDKNLPNLEQGLMDQFEGFTINSTRFYIKNTEL